MLSQLVMLKKNKHAVTCQHSLKTRNLLTPNVELIFSDRKKNKLCMSAGWNGRHWSNAFHKVVHALTSKFSKKFGIDDFEDDD